MDTLTVAERSERMGRVRSRDTAPELALRSIVRGLGYRARRSQRHIPGHPDISFTGRRKAIFLHGCFWHRHQCKSGARTPKSRVEFWKAKFDRNIARDREVERQLEAIGWRYLVVWECELKYPSGVAKRVREFMDA